MDLFKKLLKRSRAVLIHSNAYKVGTDDVHNLVKLVALGHLYQFLAQVVCKLIHHQNRKEVQQDG
jgi:hypothetical protein